MGVGINFATCEKKKQKREREREMRSTNILTDEKNKCFCCVCLAEVSRTPNDDITAREIAAAVAFVK